MNNIIAYVVAKKVWFIIGSILLLIIAVVILKGPKPPEFSFAAVEEKTLVQSVNETGTVEANLTLDYGWQTSGRVIEKRKRVGDTVKTKDILARIEGSREARSLDQARASLSAAVAALNVKLIGPSQENIDSSLAGVTRAEATLTQAKAELEKTKIRAQVNIEAAERTLETAKNNLELVTNGTASRIVADKYADLVNTMKSAMNTLTDALKKSDNILGVDNKQINDDFENVLSVQDAGRLIIAKNTYATARDKKLLAESAIFALTSTSDQAAVDTGTLLAADAISAMQSHLRDVQGVLSATVPASTLSQTSLDTHRSTITTALSSVNTDAASLTSDIQAAADAKKTLSNNTITFDKAVHDLATTKQQAVSDIQSAEATVAIQEAALAQAKATHQALVVKPRDVDVAALRADVARQQASVGAALLEYDKTILYALADGKLTKLDVDVGENISANQSIATIVSPELTIKVDVSESDVAKIATGDTAIITLDAFGDDVEFTGTIASVDPGATVISGVIYYKTTILFQDKKDKDIRTGMTANVQIITDKKDAVLVIPERAVIKKDGKTIVRVLKDEKKGTYDERGVQTGIRGDEGMIEIVSGLQKDEKIITFLKETP